MEKGRLLSELKDRNLKKCNQILFISFSFIFKYYCTKNHGLPCLLRVSFKTVHFLFLMEVRAETHEDNLSPASIGHFHLLLVRLEIHG